MRWQRLCGTFCYINYAKVEYASGEYAESVWARSHLLVQFSLKITVLGAKKANIGVKN